jgi:hypothetical protein
MGAILRVLVHRAMLSLGLGAQMKPMGAFLRLFAMLLRARWSTLALRLMGAFFMVLVMGLDGSMLMRGCSGEVYASDLIYETSL